MLILRYPSSCSYYVILVGAHINTRTCDGLTAALLTAWCGYLPCLKVLLKHGTDIHETFKDGRTLLHYATENGRLPYVEALVQQGAKVEVRTIAKQWTPLHIAVRQGHDELVTLLLKSGASVNALSQRGLTPLHHAVRCGQQEIAAILLQGGADVHAATGK